MRLKGGVAIITGASRGIGRALAVEFAREGALVALAARSRAELEETQRQVQAAGGRALVAPADLAKEEDIEGLVAATREAFGPVDILVNNAGIAGPTALCEDVKPEDWDYTMAVNVKGPFLCCRAVLREMKQRRKGRIINIGSVSSKRPLVQRTPYTAGKMALIGFTRTLAAEVGEYGITVNLICPGPVSGARIESVLANMAKATGRTRDQVAHEMFLQHSALRRFVDAEDIARLAVFLASHAGRNMTGQDINVTAGLIMY
jgi:NAD(P)-dependent dehydrogenase (short-subunit alcohol dehydrogenase family)